MSTTSTVAGDKSFLEADGLTLLRGREPDTYEYRAVSYMSIMSMPVYSHGSCSTDLGYWCETDTELMDQDDRANREDCWRDWWDSPWVEPYDGCEECDPFGDSFECVCI